MSKISIEALYSVQYASNSMVAHITDGKVESTWPESPLSGSSYLTSPLYLTPKCHV